MDSAEFDKIKFKVGLLVVIFAFITVASLILFAIKKDYFENTHHFMLLSRASEELHEGMPVLFSGVRIGVLSDLDLNDEGHVLATIKIPERHAQWVRRSSTFTLDKPFIGESKIVLDSKKMESGPPAESQVFEMGVVDDINEVIKRTRPIIDRIDRVAGNIENITRETGALSRSLNNIHTLSSQLAQKTSLLDMVTDDKQAVLALNQSLRRMPELIGRYEALSTDMQSLIRDTRHVAVGPKGSMMRVNKLLDEVLLDLQKMDVGQMNALLANAAKASTDVAKATADLPLLRQQVDDSVARWNLLLKKANAVMPGHDNGAVEDLP
ncbi:MAG: hypothetical protein Q7U57_10290 [Methylovulum sp.]|nr:hypothetical protein [Methylovulum sp.]